MSVEATRNNDTRTDHDSTHPQITTNSQDMDEAAASTPQIELMDMVENVRKDEKPPRPSRAFFSEQIPTLNIVPSLVVQAFSAGILDATTYADFATFASNQTGNTILLTVAILGQPVKLELTAISLASFLSAAFIFGNLGHWIGVRRRKWLITSTCFQSLVMFICAVLLSPSGSPITAVGGPCEWVVLSLFAIMSGAQVTMARQSGSQELPTAPMTSSYVDLVSDRYLFVGFKHPQAGPRNRRVMYISAMIIGGILGALVHNYAGSWVVVLITGSLKVVVVVLLCLAAPQKD